MSPSKADNPLGLGFLSPNPEASAWDTPAWDQAAAERYFLPKKVNRLQTQVLTLLDENKELKARVLTLLDENKELKANNTKLGSNLGRLLRRFDRRRHKAAPLLSRLRAIKNGINRRPISQINTAEIIDKGMKEKQEILSMIAPRMWSKDYFLPATLTEVLIGPKVSPKLKRLVKTYISKA